MTSNDPLLSVHLTAGYEPGQAVLDGFDLSIARGEIVGLVGESGSGKSTLARALLQLERFSGGWSQGSIVFEGRDLKKSSERELRSMRGRRMSLVLQSPMTALNPSLRIESQLKEAWRAHAVRTYTHGCRNTSIKYVYDAVDLVRLVTSYSTVLKVT